MLKKAILAILATAVIAIAVICIVAAMQPAEFKITRSAVINAPADRVFEHVNDFRKWDAWSPWAKLDPAMKTTYSDPSAGVGSTYTWAGNSDVGEGKMTILESRPPEHIRIELEFISPFAAKNLSDFAFKPDGDKTNVTWSMAGMNNFVARVFGLFVDMDKLVGGDFEKGLAELKTVAETAAK